MDPRAPEKKERLLQALNEGMVMVHLDARRPGVVVPQTLRGEAHLRLNVSYRFDPPDLSVNDWGVRQTLSFGGSRFGVAIPWSALFAITSHVSKEFWMFLEDLPPELLQTGAAAAATETPAAEKPAARPRLRPVPAPDAALLEEVPPEAPVSEEAVPAPAVAPSEPPSGPSDEPPRPASRNHLRVVK